MITSLLSEESANSGANELNFQSLDPMLTGNDLQTENDKHDAMLINLQMAFGISKESMEAMINDEHFNHQH
jgi:hypothetical protein